MHSVLSNFHFSFVCTIFFKVQLRNKLFFLVLKRVLGRRALKIQYGGQRAGGQSGNFCKCWKDLVIVYINLRRNKKKKPESKPILAYRYSITKYSSQYQVY